MEVVLKSENLSLLYVRPCRYDEVSEDLFGHSLRRSGSLYDRSPRDLEIMKRVFTRSK